jgi:hypothetical protein
VVSVMAAAVHPRGSSAVMFAAMEHLVSASKIGGAAFASASTVA